MVVNPTVNIKDIIMSRFFEEQKVDSISSQNLRKAVSNMETITTVYIDKSMSHPPSEENKTTPVTIPKCDTQQLPPEQTQQKRQPPWEGKNTQIRIRKTVVSSNGGGTTSYEVAVQDNFKNPEELRQYLDSIGYYGEKPWYTRVLGL
jgi:hypothetical protein